MLGSCHAIHIVVPIWEEHTTAKEHYRGGSKATTGAARLAALGQALL
jgi:hypothetical protein